MPHLLFYGPPGTGKTSTILAVAKQIYSPREFNSMVLEVRKVLREMLYTNRGYRRSFVSSNFIFSDLILRTFFSKTVKLSIIE